MTHPATMETTSPAAPYAPFRPGRMSREELLELCAQRDLVTPEAHTPNDFYGHAHLLKRYAGLDETRPLRAVVEHAPFDSKYVWDVDLRPGFPLLLTFADYRHPALLERGAPRVESLGPLIHYAPGALTPAQFAAEKARLGRNLLVFPHHSSHKMRLGYDMDRFYDMVAELAPDFDTVRVCMYWADVIGPHFEEHWKRGYEIVSAGHMFDFGFLPRLRSLLELADQCMSPGWGTHIGYSVLLGTPMVVRRLDYVIDADHDEPIQPHEEQRISIMQSFLERTSEVTPEQVTAVHDRWGFGSLRSPGELRELLMGAERAWEARQHG